MIIFKKYRMFLFSNDKLNIVVDRLLYTDSGQIILSIIFGLGLAVIFQKTCKGPHCMVFQPPPLKEMQENIYSFNEECYKYTPQFVKCAS